MEINGNKRLPGKEKKKLYETLKTVSTDVKFP